jgi:hypothetical protein
MLAAAALLVPAAATAGAEAAPATDAECTAVVTAHISPGFSATPGSGVVTSAGQTGTVVCTGRLYGHRITGPGTMGFEENYTTGAACFSDQSSGRLTTTLPTTAGPIQIAGALTGHRLGLVQFVDIAFPQARYSGAGPLVLLKGTCFLTPITQALVTVTGTLRG